MTVSSHFDTVSSIVTEAIRTGTAEGEVGSGGRFVALLTIDTDQDLKAFQANLTVHTVDTDGFPSDDRVYIFSDVFWAHHAESISLRIASLASTLYFEV